MAWASSTIDLGEGPSLRTQAFPEPKTAADVVQQHAGEWAEQARYRSKDPARKAMLKAAAELRAKKAVIAGLEKKLADYKAFTIPNLLRDLDIRRQWSARAENERNEQELYKQKREFNQQLRAKAQEFPILGVLSRSDEDRSAFISASRSFASFISTWTIQPSS